MPDQIALPTVAAFTTVLLGAPVTTMAAVGSHGTIEEVVVTATRREQSLQEVAVAVSSMSADDLQARGLNALSDIRPGTIPSVVFQEFVGAESVLTIAARGVNAPDGPQGTVELTVPVYIDGVFLGRAQGLGLELIDPERVEVLRGPQGQLFGRNAEGGAVQFISRKPSGEFGVGAEASFGNFDYQRYKVTLDLPQFAGISSSFTAFASEHDPYTDLPDNPLQFNPLTGVNDPQTYVPPEPVEGYSLFDAEGYRAALRWQTEDERFTVDYSYDYSEQTDTQTYLTWSEAALPADPFSPVEPTSDFPDETFDNAFAPPFESEAQGHILTLEWQASDEITLKSITAYRESSRFGGGNLGASLPVGLGVSGVLYTRNVEDLDQNQTSQELQFIGTWDRWDLTAGAIYYTEEVDDGRESQITGPGLDGPVIIAPAALQFCVDLNLDPCTTVVNLQDAETESYGVYAQGTYRPPILEDRVELIVGLRYSDDTKKARRTQDVTGPVDLRNKFSETRVDPAFTVRYRLTEDISTYLRYATAYRAGGANVRSSAFTSYDQEVNKAWELGLKGLFADGRLQANVAMFHTTVEDEQITLQEAPTVNPGLTNTVNSPEDKKVRGVELELLWAVTEALNLGFSFSYMDADDFQDIDNPFTPNVVDVNRFFTFQVPETSGSVWLDYDQPLPVGGLRLHASYAWADHYITSAVPQQLDTLDPAFDPLILSSSQWDARLAWDRIPVGDGELTVALWGRNLGDSSRATFGFNGCAFGGGMCHTAADPRTYGIEFRYDL